MHMAEIRHIKLRGIAQDKLTYTAYTRVKEWLATWSPKGNFKAVVAPTRKDCIRILATDLHVSMLPVWLVSAGVTPELFSFQISDQAVEDGRFWSSSLVICATDFNVAEEANRA